MGKVDNTISTKNQEQGIPSKEMITKDERKNQTPIEHEVDKGDVEVGWLHASLECGCDGQMA